jgi:hypothetical protein
VSANEIGLAETLTIIVDAQVPISAALRFLGSGRLG